jgi:hypothetical protein
METINQRYTLQTINDVIFRGFDYSLPESTIKIISEISLQVGAPDYVRTPVFQKRENPLKNETSVSQKDIFKKKRGNKQQENVSDDWNGIRTANSTSFQSTKIEDKTGIDMQIDNIRAYLNKLTDKNYLDMCNKIIDIIQQLISENTSPEDLMRISTILFDIASTNRFYSKMYANLYSDLFNKYDIFKTTFDKNLANFANVFNYIEYVDPNVDYDKFCENNKINEKRKSLSAFYINLMINGIIPKKTIVTITRNLLNQVYTFIMQDDKKNEVDELTENIYILYKKDIYDEDTGHEYEKIQGHTIDEIIHKISQSKVKDYKSLTNKSLFKFMDMIDI